MSASNPVSAAATHFLRFRIQYSSIALIYYDYLLTFPLEVKYIWRKRFRISTLLYIFCRYALVANVVYLLAIAGKLSQGCDHWYRILAATSVLGRAAVVITFTARTWAVYGRSRYILFTLGTLGLTCVILDIISAPGVKCTGGSSIEIVDTLLAILMVIFESLSALLTSVRCALEIRLSGGLRNTSKRSLFVLIWRQGVLYFALVSVFTVGAVVLIFHATPGSFLARLPNAFTLPVSCTLTARFILHLRYWDDHIAHGTPTTISPHHEFTHHEGEGDISTAQFASSASGQFASRGSHFTGGRGYQYRADQSTGGTSGLRVVVSRVFSGGLDDFGADPVAGAMRDIQRERREEHRLDRRVDVNGKGREEGVELGRVRTV